MYECVYTENDIRRWILEKAGLDGWSDLPGEDQRKNAADNLLNAASVKYKNEAFSAEEEVRLVTASHHYWLYSNSPEMYEDDLPIHFRPHRIYGFPVPYLKLFIEGESKNRPEGNKETEPQMKERKLKEETKLS